MIKTKRLLAAALLLSLPLGGCTPTLMTDAAQAPFEDRITEDQVTDLKIASYLLKRLIDLDKNLALDVGIDVWEQRLLLTGALDSAQALDQVAALAADDNRVAIVYNELRLVSTAQRDERRQQAEEHKASKVDSVKQTVNDYWIEAKIKGLLVTAKGVKSVNYRWRSVLNTVHVIGRARSEEERDRVLAIIRDTKGVRDVKSFLEVKPVS